MAQYLGDGLLVYFGYPPAHEDDAQRAVRAGLGILEAIGRVSPDLERDHHVRLAARIGIHTGLVVAGEVGAGDRFERLVLGDTPNVAARLKDVATPDTVVISPETQRLIEGYFDLRDLGTQQLRGTGQVVAVFEVLRERVARTRLDASGSAGLTPLAGRDAEVRLLRDRWQSTRNGHGQVVLLGGEAGIGKSQLVRVMQAHVAEEPHAWLTVCHGEAALAAVSQGAFQTRRAHLWYGTADAPAPTDGSVEARRGVSVTRRGCGGRIRCRLRGRARRPRRGRRSRSGPVCRGRQL